MARAFLKNSKTFILDESTSNLDFGTENLIFRILSEKLANRTMLIIAHRLSTIRYCDEIIVMDGGRIIERGTHDELINRKGKWNMQQGIVAGVSRQSGSENEDGADSREEIKYV